MATDNVKLQNAYVPLAYDLTVSVDLDNWTFTGEEVVTLTRCERFPDSDVIQLHAAPSMQISMVEGAEIVQRDEKAQTIHLKLANTTASPLSVKFHYQHVIQEELRGFYRATYTYEGQVHRMASTHFEPTAARYFYICHDEPAQRADFTLKVLLPASRQHYTVLSNSPLRSKEVQGDTVVYSFAVMPKCPPYLTACIVGELESVITGVNGIPVSVYCALGKRERAHLALKTAAFALAFFEKFFQCRFPLPKLDIVAVPDYPIGGMENWGCITCLEAILLDEDKASLAAKRRMSDLICHEISHNWFGNLVAVNWWEGLWLKEGFASWCGHFATEEMEKTWHSMDMAALGVAAAMDFDMYEHSHPVEVPIRDPADITQIFDSISYDKGMGLVLMLQAFLGPEKWSAAVAHYIQKYQYKDTVTAQLWEAIEESSKQSVTEAMNSFTTQMGYPILHVTRTVPGTVTLQQQPCKLASTQTPCKYTWTVPVVIEGAAGSAERTTVTLRGNVAQTVSLPPSVASSVWLTANPHRTGFYRCRYDDATFAAWLERYDKLDPTDRAALISDTVASIRMGADDVSRLAQVAAVVRAHEQSIRVLQEYHEDMRGFIGSFADSATRNTLRREHLDFLVTLGEAVLSTKPDSNEAALRQNFLLDASLGYLIDTMTPAEARQTALYAWAIREAGGFLSHCGYSPATLGRCLAVYMRLDESVGVAAKGAQLLQRLQEEDGNDEACRALIYAMCMSPDNAYVEEIIQRCIDNNGVRGQLGGNVFSAAAANPSVLEGQLWNFFKSHVDGVYKQWGGGTFRIQVIVSAVGRTLSGEVSATDFEVFFASHPQPNARLAIGRAVEDMRLRDWLNEKWKSTVLTIMKRK